MIHVVVEVATIHVDSGTCAMAGLCSILTSHSQICILYCGMNQLCLLLLHVLLELFSHLIHCSPDVVRSPVVLVRLSILNSSIAKRGAGTSAPRSSPGRWPPALDAAAAAGAAAGCSTDSAGGLLILFFCASL